MCLIEYTCFFALNQWPAEGAWAREPYSQTKQVYCFALCLSEPEINFQRKTLNTSKCTAEFFPRSLADDILRQSVWTLIVFWLIRETNWMIWNWLKTILTVVCFVIKFISHLPTPCLLANMLHCQPVNNCFYRSWDFESFFIFWVSLFFSSTCVPLCGNMSSTKDPVCPILFRLVSSKDLNCKTSINSLFSLFFLFLSLFSWLDVADTARCTAALWTSGPSPLKCLQQPIGRTLSTSAPSTACRSWSTITSPGSSLPTSGRAPRAGQSTCWSWTTTHKWVQGGEKWLMKSFTLLNIFSYKICIIFSVLY